MQHILSKDLKYSHMYEFVILHVVGGIPIVLLKTEFDDHIIREGKVYASAYLQVVSNSTTE